MVCPNCGANQPTGARFCNQCGVRLPESAPSPIATDLTCSTCGHENPVGSKFCGECGSKLEIMVTPAEPVRLTQPISIPMLPIRFVSARGVVIHFPPSPSNTWLVGREDPVNNIHPDIDLTPYDIEQTVSRRHARITLTDGQPTLISIATTNWTRINGSCVSPHQLVRLLPGDQIEFGRCGVTFEM